MNPEKMYGLVFDMMREYDRLAGKEGRAEAVAHNPEAFKDDGLEFFRSAAKAIQLINEDLDRRAVGGRPIDGVKEFLRSGPMRGGGVCGYAKMGPYHTYWHGYGILVLGSKLSSLNVPEADEVPEWVKNQVDLLAQDHKDGKMREVKLPTFADIKRLKAENGKETAPVIDLGDGLLMKAELLEGAMKAVGDCKGWYNFADRRTCMILNGRLGDAYLARFRPKGEKR